PVVAEAGLLVLVLPREAEGREAAGFFHPPGVALERAQDRAVGGDQRFGRADRVVDVKRPATIRELARHQRIGAVLVAIRAQLRFGGCRRRGLYGRLGRVRRRDTGEGVALCGGRRGDPRRGTGVVGATSPRELVDEPLAVPEEPRGVEHRATPL